MICAWVALVALCVALFGCGGGTAEEQATENFVGLWSLDAMTSDGKAKTGSDLELYKAMGVYLTLEDGGAATYELFGVEAKGSWAANSATSATLTFDESVAQSVKLLESQGLTVGGGTLTMTTDDDALSFVRIDESEKKTGDLTALMGDLGGDLGVNVKSLSDSAMAEGVEYSPLSDAKKLGTSLAEDKTCSIQLVAVGDYMGDPGYLLRITNKTDDKVLVDNKDDFTVNGTSVSPIFSVELDGGASVDEVLWFQNSDLGDGGVDALTKVKGTIVVSDFATGKELGTYEFKA